MVPGSRLGSAVLTGRGMCGGHLAWHTCWGEHTRVKGTGVYCCEMLFHSPVSADSEEVLREACGREGACGFCVEEKLNTEFLKETEKRREN